MPRMVKETAIRDRFVRCLDEVRKTDTAVSIAEKIGSTPEYLSAVRNNPSPKLPAATIANFCLVYNYNPIYILLGQGQPKEDDAVIADRFEKERNKYLDLITEMFNYIMDPTRDIGGSDPLADLLSRANRTLKKN